MTVKTRCSAIMQPYFFPYIGYFQLLKATDVFVVHDDVQWIKNGWINRNKILHSKSESYITLPVKKSSSRTIIKDKLFSESHFLDKKRILHKLELTYCKAPKFKEIYALVEFSFSYNTNNVSEFTTLCLKHCCDYLGIETDIILSSSLNKDNELQSEKRVIEIIKVLDTKKYINPFGGKSLYSSANFAEEGIDLKFLRPMPLSYKQFNNEFIPNLSIIDVMMFNSKKDIAEILKRYELI